MRDHDEASDALIAVSAFDSLDLRALPVVVPNRSQGSRSGIVADAENLAFKMKSLADARGLDTRGVELGAAARVSYRLNYTEPDCHHGAQVAGRETCHLSVDIRRPVILPDSGAW